MLTFKIHNAAIFSEIPIRFCNNGIYSTMTSLIIHESQKSSVLAD